MGFFGLNLEPHIFFEGFKRVNWDQVRSISLAKGNLKIQLILSFKKNIGYLEKRDI